jgi:hypothetical protein
MLKTRHSFTPEVAERILAFIRGGGFPVVAAEAAGVPAAVFTDWLARGEKRGARELFRRFAREVRQAAALCRLTAECSAYKKDPKFWLAHGPGRERPGYPGWAGEVRPQEPAEPIPTTPDWSDICVRLLHALADFPEARAAAAQALTEAQAIRGK